MRWAGHVARMGEETGVYRVLVGKPEGSRPLGRPRRRWVDNIRMDLQEVGCGYMDWIGLAQDRDRWRTLVSAVMNRRVPWNAGNFLTSCKPVGFSRRTLHHGVSKYCQLRMSSEWAQEVPQEQQKPVHLTRSVWTRFFDRFIDLSRLDFCCWLSGCSYAPFLQLIMYFLFTTAFTNNMKLFVLQAMIYHRNNGDYEWWVCTEGNAVHGPFQGTAPWKPQAIFGCSFQIPANIRKQSVSVSSHLPSSLPSCHYDNRRTEKHRQERVL